MQLSYDLNMRPAIAGTIYDLSLKRVDTGIVEGDTPVLLGYGVVGGTDADQVKIPSAAITNFAGVAVLQAKEKDIDSVIRYKEGDAVPLLTFGRAWVNVVGDVTVGSDVYLIYGGTGNNAGKFIAASSTDNTATKINAKFKTVNKNGIAVIELR